MLDVQTKLTYADYLETADDERYELLNGELVRSPSPREIHQYILGRLFLRLGAFIYGRNLGKSIVPLLMWYFRTLTWCSRTCCSFPMDERASSPRKMSKARRTSLSKSFPPPQPRVTERLSSIFMPDTACRSIGS